MENMKVFQFKKDKSWGIGRKVKLIAVAGASALTIPLAAQQTKYVSLENALNIAVTNNANIYIAEMDRKVSNADYHQTDAIFLPQVSVGYTAMATTNPLNAFGFLLQHKVVTSQDFDPSKLNDPGVSQDYAASVDVKMPLVNMDMIYARKGAKLQDDMYKHKLQYTKDYIQFEVEKAYTQLQFAYKQKAVLELTMDAVQQIYRSVKGFYEQGLVQKSDLLSAQVQVNTMESVLTKSKSNIENASDRLELLMGEKDLDGVAILTDSLERKQMNFGNSGFSLLRSDLMAMRKALDASNMMVNSSAMRFLPKINAFGTYQFNDPQIFRFKSNSYLAGISLSWTLFSGNQNRSKLRSAIFQRDRMKKEMELYVDKSKIEVDKTTRDLMDAEVEMKKQETSVEQAAEAFRILSDRFKEGLTNTTDLLTAQTRLLQHRLSLAQAVMSYNITQSYQKLLTTIK